MCSGFVQTVPRFLVLHLQFCRPLFCFLMFFFSSFGSSVSPSRVFPAAVAVSLVAPHLPPRGGWHRQVLPSDRQRWPSLPRIVPSARQRFPGGRLLFPLHVLWLRPNGPSLPGIAPSVLPPSFLLSHVFFSSFGSSVSPSRVFPAAVGVSLVAPHLPPRGGWHRQGLPSDRQRWPSLPRIVPSARQRFPGGRLLFPLHVLWLRPNGPSLPGIAPSVL